MQAAHLQALARYCAYQERCRQEITGKMRDLGIVPEDYPPYLDYLANDGYWNEERFALQFAGSKFRAKKWGKQRIRFELQGRGLSDALVHMALDSIDLEDYHQTLLDLLKEKKAQWAHMNPWECKQKCLNALVAKGYEMELCLDLYGK